MQVRIENLSKSHALHVEPFDMTGDPPVPVSAGPIGILPGQASIVVVHELRSLQVYEGEPCTRMPRIDTPAADARLDAGAAVEPGEPVEPAA